MTEERWREVVGYEGLYEVSTLGRVRSLPRTSQVSNRAYGGTILKQHTNRRNGYSYITLCDDMNGRPRVARRVHVLVLRAFCGPPPKAQGARHLNGTRMDCRLANLDYSTHQENCADKRRHGTAQVGERHGMALLTDPEYSRIFQLWRSGEKQVSLARTYGLSQQAISDICKRERRAVR